MENQIIRIPYKYGELINTMDDIECGKLMKALFKKDNNNLTGLSSTYYNIIIVDIENLENMVNKGKAGGKKGGRPKKEKTLGVTEIKTPPLLKKEPKISKYKIKEDNINKENNNIIDKSIIEQSSTELETFGNEDINNMQELIKKTIEDNGMIYKPGKYERPRIKNILTGKDFGEMCEKSKMTRKEFVTNIINLAIKLKYSKSINNGSDLYANYAEVYNRAVKTKNEILTPKRLIG